MKTLRQCRRCVGDFYATSGAQYYCSRYCAFWDKVDVRGDDECWPWIGSRHGGGNPLRAYGSFRTGDQIRLAHHVMLFWRTRRWPSVSVMHRCDNPSCVNPRHLRESGQSKNMIDASRKKRLRHAKLTEHAVREIRKARKASEPQRSIAKRFCVSEATVSLVVRRLNWSWVTD